MSVLEEHMSNLSGLICFFCKHLDMESIECGCRIDCFSEMEYVGDISERSAKAADILNNINNFLVSHPPYDTERIRIFVVRTVPKLLLAYQALRFPQILGEDTRDLPLKEHLSKFPEIIANTGLFLPVSACLRLVAVSLVDDKAKQTLIDEGGLKAIISHTVDDPLNPLQRESAVFVIKILTLNFPPGQEAVAKFMSSSSQ